MKDKSEIFYSDKQVHIVMETKSFILPCYFLPNKAILKHKLREVLLFYT